MSNTTKSLSQKKHKGITLFVSPNGTSDGNGTEKASRGKGGPVATIEQALALARNIVAQEGSMPAGGIHIFLREGDYLVSKTITIDAALTGSQKNPLTIAAWKDEKVRLLGGRKLEAFTKVTDPDAKARIKPEVLPHIRQCSLKKAGIKNFGTVHSRGFGRKAVPAHLELFFGNNPMPLAQWPSPGFARISDVGTPNPNGDGHSMSLIGFLEGGFVYGEQENNIESWKHLENVLIFGYWSWDWGGTYELIESLDASKRLIKTKPPHGYNCFRPGQRIKYYNVLEELDQPGEYFVDTEKGLLYFYPPTELSSGEAIASELETPFFSINEASHVTLRGLRMEACRGTGITINGGAHVTIEACHLRNIGNHACVITGGTHHLVTACEISQTGDSGIEVSGGDRKTLTPCNHKIHANHIHHFSRWNHCYTPAVQARGVGIDITNNFMHDAPHSAIIYVGNEIRIERNEIRNVCNDTDDCGAIYTGRDYTARGNIIRHNHICGVYGSRTWADAIYMDDCVSGQLIEGNIIERAKVAVQLGGGRELIVRNNIFVGCGDGITFDGRGTNPSKHWRNMIHNTMRTRYEDVSADKPPYSERYPELLELAPLFATSADIPGKIVVERNIVVDSPLIRITWLGKREHCTIHNNLEIVDPQFKNIARSDFRFADNTPAAKLGFDPIPQNKIGLPPPIRRQLQLE